MKTVGHVGFCKKKKKKESLQSAHSDPKLNSKAQIRKVPYIYSC